MHDQSFREDLRSTDPGYGVGYEYEVVARMDARSLCPKLCNHVQDVGRLGLWKGVKLMENSWNGS